MRSKVNANMKQRKIDTSENSSGAFLWSGMFPDGDLRLMYRIILLPVFLLIHGYHCLRGTPVYIQYGNHELRQSGSTNERSDDDI